MNGDQRQFPRDYDAREFSVQVVAINATGLPAAMTMEEDREDLVHHEREIAAHLSFNYALFGEAETELVGCV